MAHGKNRFDELPHTPASDLFDQPDPPCEKYRCILYEKCKAELLACEAFRYYVSRGRVVPPWLHWDSEKNKLVSGDIAPTSKTYLKVMRSNG